MAKLYPKATWKGDGKTGGTFTGAPFKVVLHTTETSSLPDYAGGNSAPHLTYNPKTRDWVQHTDMTNAARALRNLAGGVETNRANALQVEIICYSAKNIAQQSTSRLWVGDLDDLAYEDLREFIAWTGVPVVWPGRQAFSYSEANTAGFRLQPDEWIGWNGIVGHQHIPENDHWDPGALDWSKIIEGGDLPLTEKEENTVRDLLAALENNGAGTQQSRQAILDKMVKIGKNYPPEPGSGGTDPGLQRGDTVTLT